MLGRVDAGAAERVAELFRSGAAIVVASVDVTGRPSITRGWGATVSAEGYVALCISARNESAMRANLAANGRIAVTVVDPETYRSAQVKGIVVAMRDPTEAEFDRVEVHAARFTGAVAAVGLAGAGCMMLGDLVTVGFEAAEAYDQTPGGSAGQALA
jgi:flavin reductase (DIM6/NTAB) family NADH-FMN oxidoreductase RutF